MHRIALAASSFQHARNAFFRMSAPRFAGSCTMVRPPAALISDNPSVPSILPETRIPAQANLVKGGAEEMIDRQAPCPADADVCKTNLRSMIRVSFRAAPRTGSQVHGHAFAGFLTSNDDTPASAAIAGSYADRFDVHDATADTKSGLIAFAIRAAPLTHRRRPCQRSIVP